MSGKLLTSSREGEASLFGIHSVEVLMEVVTTMQCLVNELKSVEFRGTALMMYTKICIHTQWSHVLVNTIYLSLSLSLSLSCTCANVRMHVHTCRHTHSHTHS